MLLNLTDITGFLAGLLTTVAFVPQVIKTWRSGSADDISVWMFLLFSSGVLLWLIYGVIIGSVPVILANAITLLLAMLILILKIVYSMQKRRRLLAAEQRPL